MPGGDEAAPVGRLVHHDVSLAVCRVPVVGAGLGTVGEAVLLKMNRRR